MKKLKIFYKHLLIKLMIYIYITYINNLYINIYIYIYKANPLQKALSDQLNEIPRRKNPINDCAIPQNLARNSFDSAFCCGIGGGKKNSEI